jgi:NADPH:quinone reductase-like Zn-dependent oxidoreductase
MTIHEYGEANVFRKEDVPKPTPKAHDVLVRVCAASVNPVDWKIRSGGQRNIIRLRFPWILGLDVSGVVEAVGAKVTRFQVGDEVFSSPRHTRPGTYAEYVCIDEREVAKKPKNLTHDEAASIPLVGLTAYQCVVEKGRLTRGQTMLVHAGSGGVGAFAIQLGKHLGAHVVTTCSAKNADFVRDLGAERVIDYTKESFGDVLTDVDLILDSMGESAFEGNLRAVRRGGRISNISVDVPGLVARYGPVLSLFFLAWTMIRFHVWPLLTKGVRLSHVIKRCDGEQLAVLAALCESGAIRPTVEKVFPLENVAEAHQMSETHRARGKLVLHVAD